MNGLRIGSLCTGYGGLDAAVQAVIGGEHAWMAENDPHASKVLAHHWPTVPNLGDITAVDWAGIEPVDIIAAGFPCQDISNAGPREGIRGKRSGIWKNVVEAVRVLRPGLVVLENVTAIRSRGLNVVAADLAAIGYDAVWTCLRASDIDAPHIRGPLVLPRVSRCSKRRLRSLAPTAARSRRRSARRVGTARRWRTRWCFCSRTPSTPADTRST
jgi:DNA (cytosine-5)-methyltransferase 1